MKRTWGWSFGGMSLAGFARARGGGSRGRGRRGSGTGNTPRKTKPPKDVNETLVKNKLAKVLVRVGTSMGSGIFAVNGLLQGAPSTSIRLKDGKTIKFPVYEEELLDLIPLLEQSPFGRGEDTLVDTTVRNSWQLKPSAFTILNKEWDKYVKSVVVPIVGKQMEITSPIGAKLYKLLVYQRGSFFKSHRDSEKEDRMFGTLVVQLPSKFSGGQLVVRHDGNRKEIDFSSKSGSEEFKAYYSAFYCDCDHEILPLVDGVRVCLIYNLILTGATPTSTIPKAPSMLHERVEFIALIKEWKEEQQKQQAIAVTKQDKGNANTAGSPSVSGCIASTSREVQLTNSSGALDEDVPDQLVYILSHQYTPANLGYDNLKAGDKAVATLLKDLADDANICALLAILEKKTEGDECGSEFDSSDEDCYAEKEYTITNLSVLVAEPDVVTSFAKNKKKLVFPADETEIIPLNRLRELQPYKQKREDTGNEGTKVTLRYSNAAIVIFPKESLLTFLISDNDTGRGIAEQLFLTKCKKLKAKSIPNEAELKADVLKSGEFLKHMNGPTRTVLTHPQLMKLWNALLIVNETDLLSKFLTGYQTSMIAQIDQMFPLLMNLSNKFGWNYVSDELTKIFKNMGDAQKSLKFVNTIVNSNIGNKDRKESCREFVKLILNGVQEYEEKYKQYYHYGFNNKMRMSDTDQIEFLDAICTTAKKIGVDVTGFFKSRAPAVAIPSLLKLASNNRTKLGEPWLQIAKDFATDLKEVANKVIMEPEWRKREYHSCNAPSCKDCPEMHKFMIDSNQITREFPKLTIQRMNHLHGQIMLYDDLTIKPEMFGNSRSLTVTKKPKVGYVQQVEKQNVAKQNLAKLSPILVANGCPMELVEGVAGIVESEVVVIS